MKKINSNHLIIITAAALMQWHSIQFWINQVGLSGIGWSIMLETVVIWYWWNNRTILALIASLLLVAGPMVEITKPAIDEIKSQQRYQTLNTMDEADILRLEKSLKTYEKNSELRIGWSSRIDRTQNRINENFDRIRDRSEQKSDFDLILSTAIAVAQALALLVIMTAQALAISEQRKKFRIAKKSQNEYDLFLFNSKKEAKKFSDERINPVLNRKIKPLDQRFASSKITAEQVDKIPMHLHKVLVNKGITQGKWCEQHQINQKHLSLTKSHSRLITENKETAPVAQILKIIATLNTEMKQIEKEPS